MRPLQLLILLFCLGCSQPSDNRDDRLKSIVVKAKKVGDYQTAIAATYDLLSTDTNEISYYDSLAHYYHAARNYYSALKTCEHVLSYRTSDSILIIAAKSAIALNRIEELIPYAEAILKSNPENLEWSYELSKAYFNLNRGYECQNLLQDLISMPLSKVELTVTTHENKVYSIPYYTAALNLMGALLANTGQPKEARKYFLEAVRFSPDFPLPKQNLKLLKASE